MSALLDDLRAKLTSEGAITFPVRVHPGAKENRLRGFMADGTLKIDVTAPPEDGKANGATLQCLAREFAVSPSQIAIVSGQSSRRKLVRIVDLRSL